ncbi:MAG TPA: hypothetical protein VFV03_05510 [Solirubrobacteraceae bacterium]|nr:hypothetical protein [Solirubrobacteraceae bacterium]
MEHYGVRVTTPDEFLTPLMDTDSQGMLAVLARQANAWAGGRPVKELLDAIGRAGAPALAAKAHVHIDVS